MFVCCSHLSHHWFTWFWELLGRIWNFSFSWRITGSFILSSFAALGIILSAIFGLRAISRIFFGGDSKELSAEVKNSVPTDLSRIEFLPASLILSALLMIGFGLNQFPHGSIKKLKADIPISIL